jgi:hypothetical protein
MAIEDYDVILGMDWLLELQIGETSERLDVEGL